MTRTLQRFFVRNKSEKTLCNRPFKPYYTRGLNELRNQVWWILVEKYYEKKKKKLDLGLRMPCGIVYQFSWIITVLDLSWNFGNIVNVFTKCFRYFTFFWSCADESYLRVWWFLYGIICGPAHTIMVFTGCYAFFFYFINLKNTFWPL